MIVKDIMTKEIITINETDTAENCAKLLNKYELSGLPVLNDKGKLVGIVTEGDLIRRASDFGGPSYLEIFGGIFYLDSPKEYMKKLKKSMGQIVSDIMTEDVFTVGYNEKIEDAATILVEKNVKRLPVIDEEDRLVGIVSRKDIMNHLFHNE